ncbi:phenylalanine--tRNA ligase subunit beta [Thioalkalivibrio denitrificans]|uniref:Phenylalanine--tRNA ligase beta subunit n=1 Tax=Thioalkalivibrio denitrificans TaxID=108003 RepID=A0A1V3NHP6_9GAMM|nr:phenylalanine--tRNA ligase subunit beta [Thioalkalivibrio denitrificans]OOG24575.1 phenylalanine--tRNA ligase subunit beta [Thioalkalivibrio denitrificans]
MRISNQWLLEWVNHGLSPEELGHRLTMAGLELDALEPAAPAFSGVVVGKVLEVAPHPDADKLSVCQVDDGSGGPVRVVCGAPNVTEGMHVPFARVGAVLPGDFRIRKARLRGVESSGMLCSAKELGLAEASEGLMQLPGDLAVGTDVREALGLDDTILEVDLTPNRADCLSMAGVAREVATLTGQALRTLELPPVSAQVDDRFAVDIQAPDDCPVYAGRVVRGVNAAAETPLWMRERLRRAGLRSLGPLVDVTNYVMLELGQPMHAFDLARLSGGIEVRRAREGERLVLLDGQEIGLEDEDLVIADREKVLALAGIMGGEASGVGETTRDVFLESAHFSPMAIAGRARRHGLHTDSSHRFERGVDPDLPTRALQRATALLCGIAGGQAGPVVQATGTLVPEPEPVVLRAARIERVLGAPVDPAQVTRILSDLGCRVEPMAGVWRVTPPGFRFDLAIEADFIEEVARVHGYEALPAVVPSLSPDLVRLDESRVPLGRVRDLMADLGYQEAITYSFVDPEWEAAFNPEGAPLELANPISSELAVMRTGLWPGLVKALRHNLNRQQERVRLFEIGLRFNAQANDLKQESVLSAVACGAVRPDQWGEPTRPMDFFDLKGDLESLLSLSHASPVFEAAVHPALHPGRSARVMIDGRPCGWIGTLHPELAARLDLTQEACVMELELDAMTRTMVPKYREQSRFPAIRRDLAIVVDAACPVQQVLDSIRSLEIPALRELIVFDVYTGKGVPDGRKSLALGLILQELSRTLTDEEVDEVMKGIVEQLKQDVGATLRA